MSATSSDTAVLSRRSQARRRGFLKSRRGSQNHVNMVTPGCPYLRGVHIFMTPGSRLHVQLLADKRMGVLYSWSVCRRYQNTVIYSYHRIVVYILQYEFLCSDNEPGGCGGGCGGLRGPNQSTRDPSPYYIFGQPNEVIMISL